MSTKSTNFSKNILRLDVSIRPSRLTLIYWAAFVLMIGFVVWQASLWWWQIIGLIIVVAVLSFLYIGRKKVVWLGCTHIDGLWEIKVNAGGQQQLWQGYLSSIQRVSDSVMLRFCVIEPSYINFDIIIYRRDVVDDDFRKLSGLCSLYS